MSGNQVTTDLRFRPSTRPPREVSLGGMLISTFLLISLAFVLSASLFSLLPISAAVISLPIHFLLFAGWSDRMSNAQYALRSFFLYLVLLTLLISLVTLLGRRPFAFLLG